MKQPLSSLDMAIVQCLVLVALQMNAISKSLTFVQFKKLKSYIL